MHFLVLYSKTSKRSKTKTKRMICRRRTISPFVALSCFDLFHRHSSSSSSCLLSAVCCLPSAVCCSCRVGHSVRYLSIVLFVFSTVWNKSASESTLAPLIDNSVDHLLYAILPTGHFQLLNQRCSRFLAMRIRVVRVKVHLRPVQSSPKSRYENLSQNQLVQIHPHSVNLVNLVIQMDINLKALARIQLPQPNPSLNQAYPNPIRGNRHRLLEHIL